ncbi:MAG TPA: hypothetical protein VK930_12200 [Verrucomicrobiae bacterium]|jgi:hypothetical protein|nr:hypothetical protein [Verrucomicrobiae bacterium]
MMGRFVKVTPQKLMCRDRQDQPSSGCEHFTQREKRFTFLGYVLKDVEHSHQFEWFSKRKAASVRLHEWPGIPPPSVRETVKEALYANHKAAVARLAKSVQYISGSATNLENEVSRLQPKTEFFCERVN